MPEALDQDVFTSDPASSEPFIMWAGTPYERIMMPVADGEPMPESGALRLLYHARF